MTKIVTLTCLVLALLCGGCGGDDEPTPKVEAGAAVKGEKTAVAKSPTEPVAAVDSAGKAIFAQYCAGCHDAGEGHPGTMRLAVRLGSENSVLRERTDLAPGYVKNVIRNGFEMMPAFRPTEIRDAELDALAAYVSIRYKSP